MAKRVVVLVLLLGALVRPAVADVKIVATLPWIGSVAKEIGKDKISMNVLVRPNQDAHYIEAKPSMILAASKADVFMYNGLDLEAGYVPLIVMQSRNARIQPGQRGNFDGSRYVEAIEKPPSDIDRSMGDIHPMGNPHYHYSATRVLRVAEGMERVLSQADPRNAAFYTANLAAFREKVKNRQRQWAAVPLKGKRFFAYHKYFEYLAADYGFQILGYVEPKPGISPSAGHLEKLVETIKSAKPDGILATPDYGQRESELLAGKTGVKPIVIPADVGGMPGTGDWFSFMDTVLSSLEERREGWKP